LTLRPAYANIGMYQRMKNLTGLADSRSNVRTFPAGVQDDIGYALYAAQLGERSVKAKPMHGLGGQAMEKSKAGIATPKPEMEPIRRRLKELRSEVKNAEKRGP
jgi:phage-related protein